MCNKRFKLLTRANGEARFRASRRGIAGRIDRRREWKSGDPRARVMTHARPEKASFYSRKESSSESAGGTGYALIARLIQA